MFEFLTAASAGNKVNQQAVSIYILRQQFDPFTTFPSLHFRRVAGLRPHLLHICDPDPAIIFFFPATVLKCNISYYSLLPLL